MYYTKYYFKYTNSSRSSVVNSLWDICKTLSLSYIYILLFLILITIDFLKCTKTFHAIFNCIKYFADLKNYD